ncbi:MAG: hypothetical protein LAP85_15330 [Acidobacteriia bacterium]|nr:hypothetical protein [Terriglobia bacterium]
MRNYIEAKVIEFGDKLANQKMVLTNIAARGDHTGVIAHLRTVCQEAEQLLVRTRRTLALNLPQLFRRHQVDLVRIRARLEFLEEWYLPTLLQEGDEERAVSRIISRLLDQLHVPHLADQVVSFSRALSMYPGVPEHPIFFMPRYTRATLLDWTGLYHEIGHAVHQKFPEIGGSLSNVVLLYCQRQLRHAPALSTSQLDKRAERLRQTLLYWNKYRLEELFCDIFATVVAGPAHLMSWVDISLTSPRDPYRFDPADEHPPNAARTQACMLALDEIYADAPLRRSICRLWEDFLNPRTKPPLFDQLCPFLLIMDIVRVAQAEIGHRGFPVFRSTLPLPPDSLTYERIDDLQELVNVAAVNLIFAPSDFSAWQQKITGKLFTI